MIFRVPENRNILTENRPKFRFGNRTEPKPKFTNRTEPKTENLQTDPPLVPNNFTLGIRSSILCELDFEGCVTNERFCCVRKNNNKQAKTKRESIKQQKSEQIRNNGNYERIIRFD